MDRALLSQLAGKILRARDVQGLGPVAFARAVLQHPSYHHVRRYVPVSEDLAVGVTATAEIHNGGWVVRCPFCPGLEYGDPAEPRFVCCSCWNVQVGGRVVFVEFPANHAAIEAVLLKRPNGHNRGWLKGESVKQLQIENRQLGVE